MANYDSLYSDALAEEICEQLAAGNSLRAICRQPGMPSEVTVRRWAAEDRDGFAAQYARARELGYLGMADELLEIADDASRDTKTNKEGVETQDSEWVNRSRLRVDTRKWLLSKMLPKVFGDSLKLNHSGEMGLTTVPKEALEARLADLLRKAGVSGTS